MLENRVVALEAQMAALAPVLELVQSGQLEVVTNELGVTVLRLTGINLQVVNGLGVSAGPLTNGAGNVIVGYDEARVSGQPSCSRGQFLDEGSCVAAGQIWAVSYKSGSHYLVVGPENNYGRTSGIVVGQRNSSSASFGSVLAGRNNAATMVGASVAGGEGNTASASFASVSGGSNNAASGSSSVVSGGSQNSASAPNSTVSGGVGLTANTPGAHVPPSSGRLLVRTASGGATDMTGTAWSLCFANEPSSGMSRLTTFAFGAGTFTLTDVIFTASAECAGPADPAVVSTALTAGYGDRTAGWDSTPPPGLATTVTATAVLLSAAPSGGELPDSLKTLFFVNDHVSPPELHMGGKTDFAPDGYPTTLETSGRPRTMP